MYLIFAMILPMSIPIMFWGESLYRSFLSAYIGRQLIAMHAGFFVNSAAHMFGTSIAPFDADNLIAYKCR